MKKVLCLMVVFFSLVLGTFAQETLVTISDGPGRIYVPAVSPGQVFQGEVLLGSVGPEEPLLVQGMPEGTVELVFLSSLGEREVRKLDLRKNGIPTIRFGTSAPVSAGNQEAPRERAVSLVQGRNSVPSEVRTEPVSRPWLPEWQWGVLSTGNSGSALGSFQFVSRNYRSFNAGAFITRSWVYAFPQYSFQWGESSSRNLYIHQIGTGFGLTVHILDRWTTYSGIQVAAGYVKEEQTVFGSPATLISEYGPRLAVLGWEGGLNYMFKDLPVTMGLRLFTGYNRGVDWIEEYRGLTFSGEVNFGWQFETPPEAGRR